MSFPATTITAEQVAALEAAVMSGALEVSWESGGVRQKHVYRSMADLLRALDYAKSRMDAAASELTRPVPSTLGVFARD